MPKLKLSKVRQLRDKNAAHHNRINDRAQKESKLGLIKERVRHIKEVSKLPFFDSLLKKHVLVEAGSKKFILLGTGFLEKGTLRKSVVLIDEKGRAVFLAQVPVERNGVKAKMWLPYSYAKKTRTEAGEVWKYAKMDFTQRELDEVIRPLNIAVQRNIKEVKFENIDGRRIAQIKRFL